MNEAPTAEAAAQAWITSFGTAAGVRTADLTPLPAIMVGDGRFSHVVFRQSMAGLAVEHGRVQVLVRHDPLTDAAGVVHAAVRLVQPPAAGFGPEVIDGPAAVAAVQGLAQYAHLTEWTPAEPVIFSSEGDVALPEPVRAWKFRGALPDPARFESWTFFVDSASGALVHVRDEVFHTDITGHISGLATAGTLPDTGSNPPVATDLENCRARVQGGNTSYSDEAGDYVILHDDTAVVTVESDLIGEWVSVFNNQGSELHLEQSVTPPGPADFEFNSTPAEFATSQVNGFIHTTLTHDFYKDRQPGFNDLDTSLTCNVNLTSTCNAYFTTFPLSINFYAAGGGCVNSAYSSVIAHEYGHFIVNRLGLSQGAFGEGFADCCALMIYDDPIVGRDFGGPGDHIRDIPTENVQYPCSNEIHYCGMVLGGVWWNLKLNMQTLMGDEAGRAFTQQFFTDWSQVTAGGSGSNSAHPQTAIEVLTLDDDDGNLENGTPHYNEICDAFLDHGIPCPEVATLVFEYPSGVPSLLSPGQTTTVAVNVVAGADTPVPGTGTVSYQINGGGFTTVAMDETAPNEYEAALPAAACNDTVEFYFSAEASGGGTFSDPSNAPSSSYSALVGDAFVSVVDEDFEDAPGWTVSGDAADGQWNSGVPAGGGDRGDPPTDYDGSGQCFLTDNVDGNSDVDSGETILTSPAFDLSAAQNPFVSYARWYSNNFGNAPEQDIFVVEVSDDNGANWVALETVGPSGPQVAGGWYVVTFRITDYVSLTNQFRIRFNASDTDPQSVVEAGIDAFKIEDLQCSGDSQPPSVADESPARDSLVTALPSVEVTFTETVTGVDAADLQVNGSAATALTGSGAGPYSFSGYAAPADGTVTVTLSAGGIEDGAGNDFAGDAWPYDLDSVAPAVASESPARGSSVTELVSIEVTFTESVSGVTADQLTVNGAAATGVSGSDAGPYAFTGFAAPAEGEVSIALAGGTIADAHGNVFAGDAWTYNLAGGPEIWVSFKSIATVPGLGNVQKKDIVAYHSNTNTWEMVFDGSDMTLGALTIDGMAMIPSTGEILLSFAQAGVVPGLQGGPDGENVDDSDIVRFTPTSLGPDTAGTFTFHFDGSDVGLTTDAEDIDGIALTDNGKLIVSTIGNPMVTGPTGVMDEDLLRFVDTSLGSDTAGTWFLHFDGSDVGLDTTAAEDVDAVARIPSANMLLLSTVGAYSVPGLSGTDEDVIGFEITQLGPTTSGTYSLYQALTAAGIDPSENIGSLEFVE